MDKINQRIATELSVGVDQVAAAVEMLGEGATVPFIARYRKERTGGLDDTQLRRLEERLGYLRELEDRRRTVVKSIEEQGKMTPALLASIMDAAAKVDLEDPYAPQAEAAHRRRSRARLASSRCSMRYSPIRRSFPKRLLRPTSMRRSVADAKAALDGARAILIERAGERAALVGALRRPGRRRLPAVAKGKEAGRQVLRLLSFSQKIKDLPSHRALALLRGRNEDILELTLDAPPVATGTLHPAESRIRSALGIADRGRPADVWLADGARLAWRGRIAVSLTIDLMTRLKERADTDAITVFSRNLKDLLLAAPAGPRTAMGLDPGIRTGVKVAVVDATGKVVDTATVYPHEPRRDWQGALATLGALVIRHKVEIIAIGNGTASRETDKLAAELIAKLQGPKPAKVMVSEAGASVYSASELAAAEFPDLDVSLRGAVSIVRRLQDPLAELVKIEPKAIGVGPPARRRPGGLRARSMPWWRTA